MFADLFIVRVSRVPSKGEMIASGKTREEAAGIFITPKSLSTFPTASFAVTLVWLLARKLFPVWGSSAWVPVVVSLLVGLIIFLETTSVKDAKPQNMRDWFVAISVASINSLYLAASALGLLAAIR
jgi:hypothetical protein